MIMFDRDSKTICSTYQQIIQNQNDKIRELHSRIQYLESVLDNAEQLIKTLTTCCVKVDPDGTITIPSECKNIQQMFNLVVKNITKNTYIKELTERIDSLTYELEKDTPLPADEEHEEQVGNHLYQIKETMISKLVDDWGTILDLKNNSFLEKHGAKLKEAIKSQEYTGDIPIGTICSVNREDSVATWKVIGGDDKFVWLEHTKLSLQLRKEERAKVFPKIFQDDNKSSGVRILTR